MAGSTSAAQEFFASLPSRANERLLAKVSGTLRFDAVNDGQVEHWYVSMANGDVKVSRRNAKADAVIRLPGALLDDIVSGRENAMAALLRGALIPDGDPALMLQFQRIFGGPANDDPARASTSNAAPQ